MVRSKLTKEFQFWVTNETIVYPFALGIRVAFILFGEWQDRNMPVPYTDVDYDVISDAAQLVANGSSPYGRATYRYSPLLAYLLVPNVMVHRCWGKLLFSLADIAVGRCLQIILTRNGLPPSKSLAFSCLWLLNPLSINVSTRGSFDAVTGALVLVVSSCLMGGLLSVAAVAFGVVVHLRVYPIVYAPAFALYVALSSLQDTASPSPDNGSPKLSQVWVNLLNRDPLKFASISATTFCLCTAICAWVYGVEFCRGALLYHLTRTDNRHNYSIYWYWIYLDFAKAHRWLLGLAAFIPQVVLLVASAAILHGDLALCVFVQTSLFVFFNKVFTGQYITWYLCLAPLLVPSLAVGRRKACFLLACWIFALLNWLFFAWKLEIQGENTFLELWVASLLMFGTNVVVLNVCIRSYCTQRPLVQVNEDKVE